MNAIIDGLKATNGVVGCAIFDNSGECLSHSLSPPYEPVLLAQALEDFHSLNDVFDTLGDAPPTSFFIEGSVGNLLLRKISDAMTVIVISDPATNPTMISVAINVLVAKIKRATQTGFTSSSPALRPVSRSLQLSQSGFASRPPPPDSVGRIAIKNLLTVLQRHLGPAARTVLRNEFNRVGLSVSSLGLSQVPDLLHALSRHLPSQEKRNAFEHEAMRVFNR